MIEPRVHPDEAPQNIPSQSNPLQGMSIQNLPQPTQEYAQQNQYPQSHLEQISAQGANPSKELPNQVGGHVTGIPIQPIHGYPSNQIVPQAYPLHQNNEGNPQMVAGQPIPASAVQYPEFWNAWETVTAFHVQQRANTREIPTTCCPSKNKYLIFTDENNHIMNAREESECCMRCMHTPDHDLTIHINTPHNELVSSPPTQDVYQLFKPYMFGCWACGSFCQREMTVYKLRPNRQATGYIQQPCLGGCMSPKLNIYDHPNKRSQFGYVVSNASCCMGGKHGGEHTFKLYDMSNNEIGSVRKRTENDQENDRISITFPKDTESSMKLTLLSTLFFIDNMFYASELASGYKICDVYCCGCPCYCGLRTEC